MPRLKRDLKLYIIPYTYYIYLSLESDISEGIKRGACTCIVIVCFRAAISCFARPFVALYTDLLSPLKTLLQRKPSPPQNSTNNNLYLEYLLPPIYIYIVPPITIYETLLISDIIHFVYILFRNLQADNFFFNLFPAFRLLSGIATFSSLKDFFKYELHLIAIINFFLLWRLPPSVSFNNFPLLILFPYKILMDSPMIPSSSDEQPSPPKLMAAPPLHVVLPLDSPMIPSSPCEVPNSKPTLYEELILGMPPEQKLISIFAYIPTSMPTSLLYEILEMRSPAQTEINIESDFQLQKLGLPVTTGKISLKVPANHF